jgi:Zn-finger protein
MFILPWRCGMNNSSKYFKNDACEYYPCHKVEGEYFYCMFCCCPLYALGDACGGNFVYIEGGIKDCSACTLPHSLNGYDHINSKFAALAQLAKENRRGD